MKKKKLRKHKYDTSKFICIDDGLMRIRTEEWNNTKEELRLLWLACDGKTPTEKAFEYYDKAEELRRLREDK